MKLLREPIEVSKTAGQPQEVIWRRQWYQVQRIEERWLWNGRWWTTPRLTGERRCYFRLAVVSAAGSPLTMEVYKEGRNWVLSQLED